MHSTGAPAPARDRELDALVERVSRIGRYAAGGRRAGRRRSRRGVLGVIHLKDVVKEGMRERFDEMRAMGIRTVMITGDNAVTAQAIAEEAGVDDVLAEATPEDKMALIRKEQEGGRMVAMCGDGTNDAPALAQADVGVAMNTGTIGGQGGRQHGRPRLRPDQAHRHRRDRQAAAHHPRRADDVLGGQRRREVLRDPAGDVRGRLPATSTSSTSCGCRQPESAILSAVVFNALIIVALIPLALRGVRYRPSSAADLLRRNLLIYGVGGLIAPFVGIKLLDLVISLIPGV